MTIERPPQDIVVDPGTGLAYEVDYLRNTVSTSRGTLGFPAEAENDPEPQDSTVAMITAFGPLSQPWTNVKLPPEANPLDDEEETEERLPLEQPESLTE